MHSRFRLATSLSSAALIATAPLAAQSVPATNATVRRTLDRIKADNAWTLDQQQSICEIPAPPFKETVRGAEYKRRLEALGLTVRIDSIGNVIAERRGSGSVRARSIARERRASPTTSGSGRGCRR
jgi:hypothetical protein